MGILIDTLIDVKTHRDKGMYVQTKEYYINITINLFVTENVCVHM